MTTTTRPTHDRSAPPRLRAGDHVPCDADASLSVAAVTIATRRGHECVVVAKMTLSIANDGIATVLPEARPLGGDVYLGEPFASPIRAASDFAPVKRRVDVTLVGASAPKKGAVRFTFGGQRGFARETKSTSELGPVAPTHPSRWSRLGTFDPDWIASGWPNEPIDHDPLFHQSAPEAQQLTRVRGDEAFRIEGAIQGRVVTGTLPGVRVDATVERTDGRVDGVALKLDTVAFDLERLEIALVYRGHASCVDRRGRDVDRVRVRSMAATAADRAAAAEVARAPRSLEPAGPTRGEVEAVLAAGGSLAGAVLAGAQLAGIDLANVDLTGADLTGSDLGGANLSGAVLDRADLSRARASRADFSRCRGGRARFADAELGGASFEESALTAADFTRADLAGACLRGAKMPDVKLYEARVAGADLRDTRAPNARAEGADLTGANAERIDLAGADLEGARLVGAKLRGAILDEAGARRASFEDADLSRVSAKAARLSEASLERARLVGANLMQAELDRARLAEADLRGANLYRADLQGADTAGARMDKASLAGTVWEVRS